jgi:hypothetical protein
MATEHPRAQRGRPADNVPPAVAANAFASWPVLRGAFALAAIHATALLASCGNSSSAATTTPTATVTIPTPRIDPEEQARIDRERARTRALDKLKGRWKLSMLEDIVFDEDGVMLVDGPGAWDSTCGYRVVSSNRAQLRMPYCTDFVTYDMHFIEDKVRFSVPDGWLKGDGMTLTRR